MCPSPGFSANNYDMYVRTKMRQNPMKSAIIGQLGSRRIVKPQEPNIWK